jgi:hypothetical protein
MVWCPLLDSNQHGPFGPRDFKSAFVPYPVSIRGREIFR